MERAYSPRQIMAMKKEKMPFTGQWADAFGCPGYTGVWLIWGNSGNGKSSFVMQLAKYLCNFGKVFYDSYEEDLDDTFQESIERHRMADVERRFNARKDTLEKLIIRLNKRKSADIVIIDSFQAMGFTYKKFQDFIAMYPNKLLIFISRASGNLPMGKPAVSAMYDAKVKIWVEGFRAHCKGRFVVKPGCYYTIWEEGAGMYWSDKFLK